MAIPKISHRRVQLRHEASDDDEESRNALRPHNSEEDKAGDQLKVSDEAEDNGSETDSTDETPSEASDADSQTSEEETEQDDVEASIKDVSFGTLARTAESLPPARRKRKLAQDFDDISDLSQTQKPDNDDRNQSYGRKHAPPTRTSKHAPSILPSTTQVSRSRTIFSPPPHLKSRDPRFDPTILSHSTTPTSSASSNKAYSFLTTYTANEILNLKQQIRQTRNDDPARLASLKAEVMAYENRVRASEAKQREIDVLSQHRKSEKEKIRTGQKAQPYYLKRGDVRKKVEEIKVEGMGGKAKEKMERNRAKRIKTRESRGMPRERRG